MDDFAESILVGLKSSVPGEIGRRDIKIITSIYQATEPANAYLSNPDSSFGHNNS
jgi:hypothetical protein